MDGSALRCWRERHGLNQAELARLFGVRPATVSDWERGVRVISMPKVVALALEAIEGRLRQIDLLDALAKGKHDRDTD